MNRLKGLNGFKLCLLLSSEIFSKNAQASQTMPKSYKDLDIYKISFNLFIKTHHLSLQLPNFERYELGSQLRRASDSVNSNIVEGYGRNAYKKDFLKFLIYAHASKNETVNHLKKLEILYPKLEGVIHELIIEYENLGGKIYRFKEYVIKNWR